MFHSFVPGIFNGREGLCFSLLLLLLLSLFGKRFEKDWNCSRGRGKGKEKEKFSTADLFTTMRSTAHLFFVLSLSPGYAEREIPCHRLTAFHTRWKWFTRWSWILYIRLPFSFSVLQLQCNFDILFLSDLFTNSCYLDNFFYIFIFIYLFLSR